MRQVWVGIAFFLACASLAHLDPAQARIPSPIDDSSSTTHAGLDCSRGSARTAC